MLSPKLKKYNKMHRGRLKGKASRNNKLTQGCFGIQALEPIWLTSKQIEAARKTIMRYTKRTGQLLTKVYPNKSVTARAEESRMGSGKGAINHWVVVIYPGTILFEIKDVSIDLAIKALKIASYKLPMKSKILISKKVKSI